MLEYSLEQQIDVHLMQTLSSFSTSLVYVEASNEAPLDMEYVKSPDKPPLYKRGKKKITTVINKVTLTTLSVYKILAIRVSLH